MPLISMILALAVSVGSDAANTQTLYVDVTGVTESIGTLECALFLDAQGFPSNPEQAQLVRTTAVEGRGRCTFHGVRPGPFAVGVSHDANGNGRLDKNFFGIPTESWGVSRGVRPRLRAPRFEEAMLSFPAQGDLQILIEVRR